MDPAPPTFEDVLSARTNLAGVATRTPVLRSRTLDAMTGGRLFFKCENFQRAGAFKFRGAYNAISNLDAREAGNGVVTHSSGNHAAAVALAAKLRGITATIVVPRDASRVKVASIERYGGMIEFCEPTIASRESTAARIQAETGAALIHPYNNPFVIAGQGTVTLELLEDVPDVSMIIAPLGGGGLISGASLAAGGLARGTEIHAVEPEGADDAIRSIAKGGIVKLHAPVTVCDGLRAPLGSLTFPIIRDHVRSIVPVRDDDTVRAMRLAWEVLKIVIEPSSAIALAAVLNSSIPCAGKDVGVVFTGGNVDPERLPWAKQLED